MAIRPTSRKRQDDPGTGGSASVTGVVSDLWALTVSYAKQEIQDPLRGLASMVVWGIATMLLLGLGATLLALGGLRALQTETGSTFTGNLSWAPYGIVLAGSMIVLGLVGTIVTKGRKK